MIYYYCRLGNINSLRLVCLGSSFYYIFCMPIYLFGGKFHPSNVCLALLLLNATILLFFSIYNLILNFEIETKINRNLVTKHTIIVFIGFILLHCMLYSLLFLPPRAKNVIHWV